MKKLTFLLLLAITTRFCALAIPAFPVAIQTPQPDGTLVSIKLVEEDPLVIGYITRKGGSLSKYGQAYVEELLKFKEV